jgi:hypothetical protein
MIFSFLPRYFQLICILAAFLAGWYSGYTYYNVKQLKIDLKAKNELIKNRDLVISKMQTSEKITNDILVKSAEQRQQDKINYENVYSKLQNVSKQLDNSNHINGILVRTVQSGINGKTVSDADTSSRINEEATTYRASDFANQLINLGQKCTENTNQLILLQEWNRQQFEVNK